MEGILYDERKELRLNDEREKEEMSVSRIEILFQNHMSPNIIFIVSPLSIRY